MSLSHHVLSAAALSLGILATSTTPVSAVINFHTRAAIENTADGQKGKRTKTFSTFTPCTIIPFLPNAPLSHASQGGTPVAATARRPAREATESAKRKAFFRIATPRLRNAIDAMHLLSLTADSDRYEHRKSDLDYIRAQLQEALDATIAAFERGDPRTNIRFPEDDA